MDTKKRVIMALLILSIVLSVFSMVISMNASSVNSNGAQPIRQIIRVQGSSGQVQLEVEPQTAPQGGSTNG